MKQLTYEEALPTFIKNEQVVKMAKDELGWDRRELENLSSKDDTAQDEFYEYLIEAMDESEIVDSAEIEFLTSYSTTSDFWLHQFGGIYFVKNMEQGDLGYFTSIEDAKAAAKKEYGFDWDDPEGTGSVLT
jgi:hypothetical protein